MISLLVHGFWGHYPKPREGKPIQALRKDAGSRSGGMFHLRPGGMLPRRHAPAVEQVIARLAQ